MKNIAFLIEYDGTEYGGWQIQPNVMTIQECIQNAIYSQTGVQTILLAAGRTDAGVHSSGQTTNCLLPDDFPIPTSKIVPALNSLLPGDIRIIAAKEMPQNFHSRFDAIAREYEYKFHTKESVFKRKFSTYYKYPIDEDLLFTSGHIFMGKHDFTSYSKFNPSTKSHICNVEVCRWLKTSSSEYSLTIKADRFVYGMVRSIVGAMLESASERVFATDLMYALQNPDREKFIKLAPAAGLTLKKVYYQTDIFAD